MPVSRGREFYEPDGGVELDSTDEKYDVVEWRRDMLTAVAATGGTSASATITDIAVNSSTSVVVKAASTGFIHFSVSNETEDRVWIKLQAAATDNDKKGIMLEKGDYWEMPTDSLYTGEISAISDSVSTSISTTLY